MSEPSVRKLVQLRKIETPQVVITCKTVEQRDALQGWLDLCRTGPVPIVTTFPTDIELTAVTGVEYECGGCERRFQSAILAYGLDRQSRLQLMCPHCNALVTEPRG